MTMFVGERLDALELSHQPTLAWYLSLINAGLNKGDPQVNRYFGRVVIAGLDREVVDGLAVRLKAARDYWIAILENSDEDRRVFARDRLITLLELLSRLVVRLDEAHAIALHLETLEMSKRLGPKLRFCEEVGTLLKNSFEAVAPMARAPMVFADLDLPLTGESDAPDPSNWIGPVPLHEPRHSHPLRAIIARYLDAGAAGGNIRNAAIRRLALLHFLDALTATEAERFAKVAWAHVDDGKPPLPADTSIFDHFWARLVVEGRDAATSVRARLFGPTGALDRERLIGMIRAVRSGDVKPDAEQARERFDAVAALRFKAVNPSDPIASFDAGLRGYDPPQEASFAGAALTWALAPSLSFDDRTIDRFKALEVFQADAKTLAVTGAMVSFVEQHAVAQAALERLIRRGLTAQDGQQVGYAVDALRLWAEAHPTGTHSPPGQLVDQVVSLVELRQSPGLSYLLAECDRLVRNDKLDAEQLRRVQIALGDLLEETAYSSVDPMSERAGIVSLIRKSAVRLALALQEQGHANADTEAWLAAARDDPLPEVRQALGRSDD